MVILREAAKKFIGAKHLGHKPLLPPTYMPLYPTLGQWGTVRPHGASHILPLPPFPSPFLRHSIKEAVHHSLLLHPLKLHYLSCCSVTLCMAKLFGSRVYL